MKLKQVSKPSDVPQCEHYAILIFDTCQEYSPPYHEREKEGSYSTVHVVKYYVTVDKRDWEEGIIELEGRHGVRYTAFQASSPAKVEKKVNFKIRSKN